MIIKFNNFEVELFSFGNFRLDGGAMFGNVPKNLWSQRITADAENCIPLTARCLLIKSDNKKILVDVGLGDKWNEKQKSIFEIDNFSRANLPFKNSEITDVILTHLHFDHGGGITTLSDNKLELTYPNARIHLQKANYENALSPNMRERGSYFKENVVPLPKEKLNLLNGNSEVLPGISVCVSNGHTRGLQWIKVSDGSTTLAYPSDLIPTCHHISLPYIMGYDICAETVLSEKEKFLKSAVTNDWLVVFEHDRHNVAAKVRIDEKGAFIADSVLKV